MKRKNIWISIICIIVIIVVGIILLNSTINKIDYQINANDIEKIEIFDASHADAELICLITSEYNEDAIKQFASLFNNSKEYTNDAGTTHPRRVSITMMDGGSVNFWYGTQGFITFSDGENQYNMKNNELERFCDKFDETYIELVTSKFEIDEVERISVIFGKSGPPDISFTLEKGKFDKEIKRIIDILNTESTSYSIDSKRIQMNSIFIMVNGWMYSFSFDDEYITYIGEPASSYFDENKKLITIKNDELIAYLKEVLEKNYDELATESISKQLELTASIDYETRIKTLIGEIASSPAISSNPYDYIKAHPDECNEIVSMGFNALYSLSEMLNQPQLTLEQHIAQYLIVNIFKDVYSENLSIEQKSLLEDTEAILIPWEERNKMNPYYSPPSKGGPPSLFVWKNRLITGNDNIYYSLAGVFNKGIRFEEIYYSILATDNIDFVRYIIDKHSTQQDILLSQVDESNISKLELTNIAKEIDREIIVVSNGMFESISGFTEAQTVNHLVENVLYKVNRINVIQAGNETYINDNKLIREILLTIDLLRLNEQKNQQDSTGYNYYFDLMIDDIKILRITTYGDANKTLSIDNLKYDVLNYSVFEKLRGIIKTQMN